MDSDFDPTALRPIHTAEDFRLLPDRAELVTSPHTDLWQRTYYGFRNDNAPMLVTETDRPYFSFTVRTEADTRHRFDQCGIAVYLDSDNWLKASVEHGGKDGVPLLGSVVTNAGWSDWATCPVTPGTRVMWYRLSRRGQDFRLEASEDGRAFRQLRICRLHAAAGTIPFGVYACSPEDSSFRAVFTDFALTECLWAAHDGQPPDPEI